MRLLRPFCLVLLSVALLPGFPALGENLFIQGGTVVTAEGSRMASVRIRGEKIVEVGDLTPLPDEEKVIDATDLLVLPGGIDPHVHLAPVKAFPLVDDFESGTRAALAGGITTVGHMAIPEPGDLPLDTMARARAAIEAEAVSDVFVHTAIFHATDAAIAQLPKLVEMGQPSVKVFMPFDDFDSQMGSFLRLMKDAGERGIRVAIHCEDANLLEYATQSLIAEGKTSFAHYEKSRPVVSEAVATHRAIGMAEATGASIYIVHLAAAPALHAAAAVRERLPVFVETRPIYLHLTADKYAQPDGKLFVGFPPIRGEVDRSALWLGLANGTVDTVASDHAPWMREQKLDPTLTIEHPRPGVNNLQVMLPMLFSEGVLGERLSIERFVAVTSTNAAKLFGLYPRKGTIAAGSDADLVLWDPKHTQTIRDEDALSKTGFSIYSGTEVTGWPQQTIRRGQVVYEGGTIRAAKATGQLIPRNPITSGVQ